MLIRNAEIYGSGRPMDVRIANGRIRAIGQLPAQPGEHVLDAAGAALLPGLHDHHVHLMSYAASLDSVACGPPAVGSAQQLAADLLRQGASASWLRGVGYHESVAGDIDRHWLDRHGPDRPVRIQHRSGRLWILNSRALDELAGRAAPAPQWLPEDGRLFDADVPLRTLLGATLPPIGEASRILAGYGVTGLTDMTPHNDNTLLGTFRKLRAGGDLLQRLRLAGRPELDGAAGDGVTVGETKFHLHEADLPRFDELVLSIRASHDRQRAIAVHCVTETELVFTLAAIREAGTVRGDRIEHASVTPPALLEQIQALGLVVVTQPNFVMERGDAYVGDLPPHEHDRLYRCRAFLDAGVPLAGGTDMPFGRPDPWAAMQAAVTRRTAAGRVLGEAEALTPEQALGLFIGAPQAPGCPRAIAVGEAADLCLLDRCWERARRDLRHERVAATFVAGTPIWQRQAGKADG